MKELVLAGRGGDDLYDAIKRNQEETNSEKKAVQALKTEKY